MAARRGRGARDVVEHLAVLHAVVGHAIDGAARREVDRDHLPVLLGGKEERRLRLRARNVVEGLPVVDDRRGRGRAEVHAHLLLAHAGLDLLQVAVVELGAVLQVVASHPHSGSAASSTSTARPRPAASGASDPSAASGSGTGAHSSLGALCYCLPENRLVGRSRARLTRGLTRCNAPGGPIPELSSPPKASQALDAPVA